LESDPARGIIHLLIFGMGYLLFVVRSPVNERSASQNVVRIPCEYCNEQIDLRIWSTHTVNKVLYIYLFIFYLLQQDCRERELRRLEDRAE
jgi:hypothetical protein